MEGKHTDCWDAFAPNAAFAFGNAARNLIGGPPLRNLDMALYKTVPMVERVPLQFRAEVFNATNTPMRNLRDPSIDMTQL
jgi:hypothetical protein